MGKRKNSKKIQLMADPPTRNSIELGDTQVSGYRASDLRSSDSVYEDTLFAVQQGAAVNRVSYSELSSDIKSRALSLMRVKSMAYMEPWQYSPSSHNHVGQYTYASAQALYGRNQGELISKLSVGNISVENPSSGAVIQLSAYCPMPKPAIKEPAYGTLRFMYAVSSRIDDYGFYIASENFDGWVYPNGKSYPIDIDQFTKGKNPFITNEEPNPFINANTRKLNVPRLENFLSANPFFKTINNAKTCSFYFKTHNTAVAEHSHAVQNLNMKIQVGIDIQQSRLAVGTGNGRQQKNCVYQGRLNGDIDPPFRQVRTAVDIDGGGIQFGVKESGENNPETWPEHDRIAVMVYVGGRKKEYEKIYV